MIRNIDYGRAAGFVFLTVAVAHLVRAASGWEVIINGMAVPIWFSWLVVLVASALGLSGMKQK